jgi:predicted regulator of Ras-like GTPase activity (Roadblock/LC7/MglB family)
MNRTERIAALLRAVCADNMISDAWLVSADGLILATAQPMSYDAEFYNTWSAAVASQAQMLLQQCLNSAWQEVEIVVSNQRIMLFSIYPVAVLTLWWLSAPLSPKQRAIIAYTITQLREFVYP